MPPKKAAKQFLAGVSLAIAGDLGGQWTAKNIDRWVGLRGGKFVQEVDSTVTHLVCGATEYKEKDPQVRKALKRGKACQIVSKDWLEDSLAKERKLPEKSFLHRLAHQKERRQALVVKRTAKNAEEAFRFVNRNLYHVYYDSTFFAYEVTLTRDDAAANIVGERYVLYLFESNAKPHLYWFAAKHFKSNRNTNASFFRPSDTCQVKEKELEHFKAFFRKKTGVEWGNRLIEKAGEGHFAYEPPKRGKPMGEVEEGKHAVEEQIVEEGGRGSGGCGGGSCPT